MNIEIVIPKKNTTFSAIRQILFKSGKTIALICFTNDPTEILNLTERRCKAMNMNYNDVVSVKP